jgi:N-methylhydantoinase A/oxoprolinase/acetone carboxylase beta subunit
VYAAGAVRRFALVHRAALGPDSNIAPETIVEQEDATIVVPAGWHGRVGAGATLVLEREGVE